MATIKFSMKVAPKFTKNAEGNRTGEGGVFQTSQRIDKELWMQMKQAGARFISDEDAEDGIGIAGWNYPLKSLTTAIRAGHVIKLDGIECKTIRELFDACENLPRLEKEAEEKRQARSAAIDAIQSAIHQNGDKPDGIDFPDGEIVLDSRNIYGSGSCFVVNENEVWFIQQNGMDGDDWSKNNIPGAIAYRILDQRIAKQLRELIK